MKPLYLAISISLLPLCAAAHITEPANSIDISLSVTHVSSAGATDGAIVVTVNGSNPPYIVSLSGINGLTIISFTADFDNLAAGTNFITVTDATGATATATATILEPDPILLSADVTDPGYQFPYSGKITLNVCGGTPQYTYIWSTGNTTKNLTNLSGGVYSVTVIDNKGCTATLPVAVNDPGDTSVFFWLELFDNMRCDTPCAQIILNPQQGVEYVWTGPGGFTSTALSNQLCFPGIYQITAWVGGPTDPTITVQWLSGPDGTISLAVPTCGANTCPEPALLRVPVLSDLAKIEGPDRVCPGTEATYTISPFDGTYFSWKILGGSGEILEGQGTNEVQVRWNFPNSSTSRLIVEYENCYLDCSGSDTLQVRVRPPFGLHGPVELCADATGTVKTVLGTSGTALSSLWTLHAPTGSVVWTSPAAATSVSPAFSSGPGSYRLVAVPDPAVFNNTCSDSAEWKILVAPKPAKPTGIDGPDQYCPGAPTSFSALGIAPQNKAVWSIKNTDANPIAREGNPVNATFTAGDPRWVAVRQVSTEGPGCTSDTIRLLLGAAKPLPVSGAPGVCAGAVATYSAPDYPNFDYQWTIIPADAGAISAVQGTPVVEIFWPHAGVFEVQLSICSQTTSHAVEVWALPQPKPQFPEGVCPGDSVVVSAVAVFDAYLWKNESGAAVGMNQTALVPAGAYALVATDDRCCRGTAEFFVKEFPKPNLTISTLDPTGFCANSRTVKMTALTTEDGDFQYEWFQDGFPVGGNAAVFYTSLYGNYTARVTNQYGCSATDGPIRVFEYCGGVCHNPNHAPKCPTGAVDIGIQPLPQCTDFQFNVLAGADYLPGSARWRFGESGASFLGSSTDDNPVFAFPNAGQYIVVL